MTVAPSDCLFCRIARGEIPTHRVYESPRLLGFLDIQPIRRGHVLLVPREHFAYFDDLPAPVAAEIFSVAQRLAPILRQHYSAQRVGFMFTGTDVAHAHAHVVPMVENTDLTSRRYIAEEQLTFRPAPRADAEELKETARRIQEALS